MIRLLGAHHDGRLELTYQNVLPYALDMPRWGSGGRPEGSSHGDWLVDEVRSEGHRGRAVHEIEWASGTSWIIDCGEINVVWLPLEPAAQVHSDAAGQIAASDVRPGT